MKKFYILLVLLSALQAFAQITTPSPIYACDNGGGFGVFDLTSQNEEILNGANPAMYNIRFYTTLANAGSGIGEIVSPTAYSNTSANNQIVFVRVDDLGTSMMSIFELELIVSPMPTGSVTGIYAVCEGDLGSVVFSAQNGTPPYTFTYTLNNGLPQTTVGSDNSGILLSGLAVGSYTVTLTSVTDSSPNNCTTTVNQQYSFVVNNAPVAAQPPTMVVNEEPFDAVAVFDLTTQEAIIISGQANLNVLYYLSEADAHAQINPLMSPMAYSNTSNPQTIFVRVSDQTTGCHSVTSFSLLVTATNEDYITFADPDLKTVLVQAAPGNWIAANTSGFSVAIDINGDGEIQYSEAALIGQLYIANAGISDLGGLEFFINLTDLSLPSNDLTSFDASNFSNLSGLDLSGNNLTSLDVTSFPELCLFDCSNNPLLEYVLMKNGNGGCYLEFSLNNNPSLEYVCTDANEILYWINYFGNNSMPNVAVTENCTPQAAEQYNVIEGYVKFDANGNGCDLGDPTFDNIRVDLQSGANTIASFTDASGLYRFYVPAGSYTVATNFENQTIFTLTPVSHTVTFATNDGSVSTNNFCIAANGVHQDIEIVIVPRTPARPGFPATYDLVYRNKGNQIISGPAAINFTYDEARMDFTASDPAPNSQAAGSLNFVYSNLMPFETRVIELEMTVNSPVASVPVTIGDVLNFTASIEPVSGDALPADNNDTYNQIVVGSYDPNDKICLQGETVSTSMVGDYLYYVINFENVGNFAAENIVVEDLINPAQYDISSLQVLHTSHPAIARINENVIKFYFENINLSSGGHGNILMKIKTLPTLADGTTVANRANIFFDYNAPVITNFANTQFQSLSVANNAGSEVLIYPNPAESKVFIVTNAILTDIALYDLQGRLLTAVKPNATEASLNIEQYPTGMYFVKVQSAQGTFTKRIVKN